MLLDPLDPEQTFHTYLMVAEAFMYDYQGKQIKQTKDDEFEMGVMLQNGGELEKEWDNMGFDDVLKLLRWALVVRYDSWGEGREEDKQEKVKEEMGLYKGWEISLHP